MPADANREYPNRHVITWSLLVLLAAVPLATYWPTLDNYFLNSDFAHIYYANRALADPGLFVHEFFDSWLGARDFELVYRPLPLCLLALNLAATGINPFGFHLTSLVLHVLCSWCVFFFARELVFWVGSKGEHGPVSTSAASPFDANQFGFLAALLFAVYPVTAEAINWTGGRPDCAAGLFSLLTLIFWIKEQNTGRLKFGLAAMASYLVALLFKETPVALIFVPMLLQLMRPGRWKEKFLGLFRSAWKLMLVIAVYLGLRWNALGTVFGGYKGVYWQLSGAGEHLLGWTDFSVLQKLLFPFNIELPLAEPMHKVVSIVYVAGLLIFFTSFRSLKRKLTIVLFLIFWFLIGAISGLWGGALTHSLAGGRTFYTACVPFCLMLAVLLSPNRDAAMWRRVASYLVAAGLLICFIITDVFNNQVWNSAADSTRALKTQLEQVISELPPERNVVVLNPPLAIAGMYGLNQALLPLTQTPPFTEQSNFHRVVSVDREHYVERDANLINATALRQVLLSSPLVARWNKETATLGEVVLIPDSMPVSAHSLMVTEEESGSPDFKSYEIVIDPPLTPLTCEAIELEFSCEGTAKPGFGVISWRDDWRRPAYDTYESDVFHGLIGDGKKHVYRFPLAEQVGWYLENNTETLHLAVHNVKRIGPVTARLATDAFYVPSLRADRRFFVRTPRGLVPKGEDAVFICDTEVEDAAGLLIELSKPNECFETYTRTYRDVTPSEHARKSWTSDQTTTTFDIPVSDLPPGFYCVRAVSIDKNRCIVGGFGDPVVFVVPEKRN